MPPRIDNAVQGAAMQHVQDVQAPQPQAHQVNLGRTQSIGITIARVIGAVLTAGLSEGVIAIFKAVRNAFSDSAQPHLPANRQNAAQCEQVTHLLNEDFAGQINVGRNLLQVISDARDTAFADLAPKLGLTDRDTIDNVPFKERVRQAIVASPTLITKQELPALATKVAHDMLLNNFFQNVFDSADVAGNTLEPSRLVPLQNRCKNSVDMQTLLNTAPNENTAALLAKIRNTITTEITSLENSKMACKEMIAEGLQRFQTLTGLDAETAGTLYTGRIVDRFTASFRDLLENPDINARTKDDFRAAHQKAVDEFFTGKAEAYNSIASLRDSNGLPPEVASKWQKLCLESTLKLPAIVFNIAHAAGNAARKAADFETMVCTNITNQKFIDGMREMFTAQSHLRKDVFKESSYLLDPPERNLIVEMVGQHILASIPAHVCTSLNSQAERMESIHDQLEMEWDTASDQSDDLGEMNERGAADRAALESAFGTKELYEILCGLARESVHNA